MFKASERTAQVELFAVLMSILALELPKLRILLLKSTIPEKSENLRKFLFFSKISLNLFKAFERTAKAASFAVLMSTLALELPKLRIFS